MITEIFLFLVVVVLLFLLRNKEPPGAPPGPTRWPIIGSFSLASNVKDQLALIDKYGDVVSLGVGGRNFIMVSNYKLAKEAFSKTEMNDRPGWRVMEHLGDGKPGIIGRNGDSWRISRRFHLRNLRDLGMGKSYLADAIHREAKLLVEDIRNYTDKPTHFPQSINVAVLNVIWQLVASRRYDLHEAKILELLALIKEFQKNAKFVLLPDIFPWLNYLPNVLFKRLFKYDWREKNSVRAKAFMKEIVDDHKTNFDPNNPRDVIDNYLIELDKQKNETDSEVFSEDDLIRDIFDLFAAGFDTTSSTIRWASLYLASHPEVQKKVQRELDDVVGRDTLPSLLHRPRLHYLEATLHEVLRLAPPAISGAPRMSADDVHIGGYLISKGSTVFATIGAIQQDNRYWEQPEKFYPERFIDESGNFSVPKEGFLPFSVGKRSCIGEALARMELYLFAAALLQNFSFAPPEGCQINLDPLDAPGMMLPREQDLIITSRT
ncbi:cytochrome P450 2L1-like isoform X2 [Palaemon carinicauda]